MTNTQQNEAMQAVRLLYDAALSGVQEPKTQAQIETLYQARRMLETFIESAGEAENKPAIRKREWNPREIKDPDKEPNISGFYLGDKVICSDEVEGYVMWLDQNKGLIGCYLDLVGEPNVIEAHPSNLELVSHGNVTL